MIDNPLQYQANFFHHMDAYAEKNNLTGKELSVEEVEKMFNDVCEELRQVYRLTINEHVSYKNMMKIIFYGKDKVGK